MQLSDVRPLPLFAGTTDEELQLLVDLGDEVGFAPGDEVFHDGEPADFWWVLVEGALDLVRKVGREETRLGAMDLPGQWAGGFRAWDAHGVYFATARAISAGRLLRVPSTALRRWSTERFPFGEHILEGVFHSARAFESDRPAARVAGRARARSPRGSRTRSTTRRPRPPGRPTCCARPAPGCSPRCPTWPPTA